MPSFLLVQGAKAYSMDFEMEAVYVGAYYVARAGYNVVGAERLSRALAQEDPKQMVYAGSASDKSRTFRGNAKNNRRDFTQRQLNQPLTPEMM